MNKEIIQEVIKKEKQEIKRRIEEYRNGKGLPDLTDRTVILVDDGIATGATLFAVIAMCQKQDPQKLVVAAPISGITKLKTLEREADEVIIPEKREHFFSVSQGYNDFSNLTDDKVICFMNLWRKKTDKKVSINH